MTFFLHSVFTWASKNGRWEKDSQPADCRKVALLFGTVNKGYSHPIYTDVSFSQSLLSQWVKRMCCKPASEVCWWWLIVEASYIFFFFSFLFLLLFSLFLLGFWSTPSWFCSRSSFHPTSIWLILTHPPSSNVTSYLAHYPSPCSSSILPVTFFTVLSASIAHSAG